ncbi:MAG: septation protein A [Rhizobiales bacterium]|nr:septation protein A [Hyphomicrobiales bacterium]
MSQGRKQLLEFAPLLVFFAVNWKAGIFWATGVFMALTLAVLLYTYLSTGKVAKVPLATAILVGVFGGLTLYLHDEIFIKVKVTLVNAIFAVLLLGGVAFQRHFIKDVMGEALTLPDSAWRTLSLRWGVFFAALALLNEVVWRHFTTDQWVTFKVFGLMGLTLVFALANAPFMARYMTEDNDAAAAATDEKPSVDG